MNHIDGVAKSKKRLRDLTPADVAYEDVRKARLQLPTVRDSNLSLVHREISRLQGIIGVPTEVR